MGVKFNTQSVVGERMFPHHREYDYRLYVELMDGMISKLCRRQNMILGLRRGNKVKEKNPPADSDA